MLKNVLETKVLKCLEIPRRKCLRKRLGMFGNVLKCLEEKCREKRLGKKCHNKIICLAVSLRKTDVCAVLILKRWFSLALKK